MAKISLDVPDDLHFKMKDEQLKLEKQGTKINLKDMYYDIIRIGLNAKQNEKKEN